MSNPPPTILPRFFSLRAARFTLLFQIVTLAHEREGVPGSGQPPVVSIIISS
jgi:hypothetical protein